MDLLDLWKPALLVSVKFLVLDTVLITDPTSVLSFGIWVTLGAAPCDLDTFLNLWLNLTSNHPQSAWIQLLGTSLNCGCQPVCESRTQRFGPKLTLGAAPGALMHFLWMVHWILLIVHLSLSEPSILVSATTVWCLDFLLNHWTYKCLNHWTRAYFRGSTKWLCESLTESQWEPYWPAIWES